MEIKWPDTNVDRRAWELAKIACGPGAELKQVIARAQEIKDVLKKGEL